MNFFFIKERVVAVFILFSFTLLFSNIVVSQPMPAFSMMLSNGKMFSSKDISAKKPVIIIYFAPDCEHCQVLMHTLFKRINDFKKAQIVMVTFEPVNDVKGFEKQFKTSGYSNIKVGTEVPTFFLRQYYELEHTPFTALIDKYKKLIVSYKDETPVDDLVKHLNKL